ncbi:VF530 family DNA-binding protein [Candidatus Njordibacter sp. Uisw_058]|uniref:VF530 family protein n=1 Tax=Candidatus Njordibacter sp. Uisw_058 TaxID=3230974 RepID=UPI003D53A1C2
MSKEVNYQNNPLHGLNLKTMLTEIVDHYGFEILHAYLYIHSFKTNPSVDSSVKFLKKTQWAREKVEAFYLYKFKNLPKVSSDQFELPPRDRIIPEDQSPGTPCELSLEDAGVLQQQRESRANEYDKLAGRDSPKDRQPSKTKPKTQDKPWSKQGSKSPWEPQAKSASSAEVKTSGTTPDPWANSRNKFKS